MNENLAKYITIFKQNKQLMFPVMALMVVFLYNIVGDFLFSSVAAPTKSTGGQVEYENQEVYNGQKERANYKISENETQLKLAAGEELEIRNNSLKDDDTSYMRKQLSSEDATKKINIGTGGRLEFGKKISDRKNCIEFKGEKACLNKEECKKPEFKDLPECLIYLKKDCDIDKDTSLEICTYGDKKCIEIDGKLMCFDKETCKNPKYKDMDECKKYNLINKRKNLKTKRNIDSRGLKNRSKMAKEKIGFGLSPDSQEYMKMSILLSFAGESTSIATGFIGEDPDYGKDLGDGKDKEVESKKSLKEEKIKIRPGSSYLARLMNPINSLYADSVLPIIDILDGDLEGYRLIGEIQFGEASNGLIITGTELVSPTGKRTEVLATAVRFEGDELTPLFADEIDRNIMGRVGYSVMAAFTSDYTTGKTSNSENKQDNEVEAGDSTLTVAGPIVSQTFTELAEQYVTEVKVNPQTLIVMFY